MSDAAGEDAVERIREHVNSTLRPEVIGDLGGFGGLFALRTSGLQSPVLVASTDGVGTKAYLAAELSRYETIGIDLVAMSVDDVAVQGAEPLFFLDYVSVGELDSAMVASIVGGIADGCRQAGCTLLGGEMSQHPGAFKVGDFDLVGFAVGLVERTRILPQSVSVGDRLVGFASTGLRCNGYSLARKALFEVDNRKLHSPAWPGARRSLADELMHPSVIYSPAVHELLRACADGVHALAHVTSGGIPGNLARVLPTTCDAVIRRGEWKEPRIFSEIQKAGNISPSEMEEVFNLGLGMLAVVAPSELSTALDVVQAAGHEAWDVGEVIPGNGRVTIGS